MFLFIVFALFSLLFYVYLNEKIANVFNIYDVPDKRKMHEKKVPLTGGIFFFIIIILSYINYKTNTEISIAKLLFILSYFFLFFIIGLIDDKNNLKPVTRVVLMLVISLLFLSLDELYNLKEIKILFGEFNFYKKTDTTFLTAVSIISLVIIYNMVDGLDGLAILIFLTWIMNCVIFYNLSINNNIFIILGGIIFLYFNFKKKIFLGSSGNMLLALFMSIESINIYNTKDNFDILQALLFFMIPLIDSIRLFFYRVSISQNPLKADNKHLHHFIYNFSKKYYLLIYILIMIIPVLTFHFLKFNILLSLLISVIIYYLIFFFLKKTKVQ